MERQPEDEDLSEDWGESIDDAGPEFYEGLVDDVQDLVEQQQEFLEELQQFDDDEPLERYVNASVASRISWNAATLRKDDIVQWLVSSKFARRGHGRWFHVVPRHYGRLRSGRRVELVSWLLEEGIDTGDFGWEVRRNKTVSGVQISIRRENALDL